MLPQRDGAVIPAVWPLPEIVAARGLLVGLGFRPYSQEIAASSKKALKKSRGLTLEPATSCYWGSGNS